MSSEGREATCDVHANPQPGCSTCAWAAGRETTGGYGHAADALARLQAADEGAAAAAAGLPITACPYTGEWVRDARRRSWERAWSSTARTTTPGSASQQPRPARD